MLLAFVISVGSNRDKESDWPTSGFTVRRTYQTRNSQQSAAVSDFLWTCGTKGDTLIVRIGDLDPASDKRMRS